MIDSKKNARLQNFVIFSTNFTLFTNCARLRKFAPVLRQFAPALRAFAPILPNKNNARTLTKKVLEIENARELFFCTNGRLNKKTVREQIILPVRLSRKKN